MGLFSYDLDIFVPPMIKLREGPMGTPGWNSSVLSNVASFK